MSESNPDFWVWVSGLIASLWLGSVGIIFGTHMRKQNTLEKKIDDCYNRIEECHRESDERVEFLNRQNLKLFVPRTECVLLNRSIGSILDEIKIESKEQRTKLEDHSKMLSSIDTKLDLIVRNSESKRINNA